MRKNAIATTIARGIAYSVACGLACSLALAARANGAAPWQLSELMQTLRLNRASEASFVEKRYLKIVDEPLESSGTLRYVPPRRLEKRTLKPKPESLIVDGDELIVDRPPHREVHVNLDERPELAALVDSIRGTLAGDETALERVYQLQLEGGPEHWRLTLLPKGAGVARIVARIRLSGSQAELAEVDFQFADGDRSEMTVTHARTP